MLLPSEDLHGAVHVCHSLCTAQFKNRTAVSLSAAGAGATRAAYGIGADGTLNVTGLVAASTVNSETLGRDMFKDTHKNVCASSQGEASN